MGVRKYKSPDGFPTRFRDFLNHFGLTPTRLAETVDQDATLRVKYNRYLTGEYEPKFDVIIKVAQVYPVSLDWLLLGAGSIERAPCSPKAE